MHSCTCCMLLLGFFDPACDAPGLLHLQDSPCLAAVMAFGVASGWMLLAMLSSNPAILKIAQPSLNGSAVHISQVCSSRAAIKMHLLAMLCVSNLKQHPAAGGKWESFGSSASVQQHCIPDRACGHLQLCSCQCCAGCLGSEAAASR